MATLRDLQGRALGLQPNEVRTIGIPISSFNMFIKRKKLKGWQKENKKFKSLK